ncbi:sensor domain-containing diguanylate cyclase [Paenibacillus ginsengarvi]|nr:sensor domain-containing diguanylate cyclase [Paenibacillus ginsengarvi]
MEVFQQFIVEIEKRLPREADVFALADTEACYLTHHTAGGSPVSCRIGAYLFENGRLAEAIAAAGSSGAAFAVPVHLPITGPQDPSYTLAVCPIPGGGGELVAYLLRITDASVSEEELALSLGLAGTAFGALLKAQEAEEQIRSFQSRIDTHRLRAERKQLLYELGMQIQSRTDSDNVLRALMRTLEKLTPGRKYDIYLSHEKVCTIPSVKPLQFQQREDDSRFRAFTESVPVVGRGESGKPEEAAFPLRGKQSVYGVLLMEIADGKTPELETMREVAMLSDTAGCALENAALYEQSNRLVSELRLINEMSKRLNQSLKLQDIFHLVSTELSTMFEAEFTCILELDKQRGDLVVRAGEPNTFLERRYPVDSGFAGRILETRETLIISDYDSESGMKSDWMDATFSRSMLACPILVEGAAAGVIMIGHRQADYFSYENYKLLQTLSGHIGLAVSNASLHAEVRKMMQTDRLTGLLARHYLDDQIGQMQKKDYCGSLIVVDIDDFKKVNDTFGHQIGDQVLTQVSSIIRTSIREGDIASRWGGEELAVYLTQATGKQAMVVAERIRARVQAETFPKVSVSCGVSDWSFEDEKISVESLFYRADMALYRAKHSGKNRISAD